MTIHEPARDVPVWGDYDLCVLGGSCTGVFAAVRAARPGLSVAIIERAGSFGGVASSSLVNVWHSPLDEVYEKTIFSGLTVELMERLKGRGAVLEKARSSGWAWAFNSAEMKIELDKVVLEHGITPWFHTCFCAPHVKDGQLKAVLVEGKSGRGAIFARFFVDATGDGDLCHRLGLEMYRGSHRQPSTTCAVFEGWNSFQGADWSKLLRDHCKEFDLPEGFAWTAPIPGSDLRMFAGTRVYQDCSDSKGLTQAEIEGRRQVSAVQQLFRQYAPHNKVTLVGLPERVGIRETRHVRSHYRLTGVDVLNGRKFPDAIANGSYRVDIHHDNRPGLTFRYLNGRETYERPGHPPVEGRWRAETASNPTYYQIPYRSMLPQGPFENILAAGRFIDADDEAHAAIRVMVNMNQTGEAAGTAAYLALKHQLPASAVDPDLLRRSLADGGSIVL